jgi:prevent-host-death family protein
MKTIKGIWNPFCAGAVDPQRVVNIDDARARLFVLLRQVERGQEITIARAGKPIAKIVALL